VRVFVGRDPQTGRVRLREKTVQGTKRDAERVLTELVSAADNKLIGPTRGITVEKLLDRWLEHAEPDLSPKTVLEVRGHVRRSIGPLIGNRRVTEITTAELDAFYAELRTRGGRERDGLSPGTVRKVHAILRRALSQAVKWGIIRHNPAVDASPPRVPKPEISPPTPEQVASLFTLAQETEPALATFIVLAASSGARRSELIALRWRDIDLTKSLLLIRRGIVRGANGLVEKDTKTHQARRITLDPFTITSLDSHRFRLEALADAAGASVDDDSFVFAASVDGLTMWSPESVSRSFKRLTKRAGVRNVRLHDLRHSTASRLLAAGVDVRTVAGRLGHRDPSTTLNVYSHFIPEADQKAATVLGDIFESAMTRINRGQ
jgi:integrase